jgi:hypothetical protein
VARKWVPLSIEKKTCVGNEANGWKPCRDMSFSRGTNLPK